MTDAVLLSVALTSSIRLNVVAREAHFKIIGIYKWGTETFYH